MKVPDTTIEPCTLGTPLPLAAVEITSTVVLVVVALVTVVPKGTDALVLAVAALSVVVSKEVAVVALFIVVLAEVAVLVIFVVVSNDSIVVVAVGLARQTNTLGVSTPSEQLKEDGDA